MLYCSKNSWKVHSLVESCETSRKATHRLGNKVKVPYQSKVLLLDTAYALPVLTALPLQNQQFLMQWQIYMKFHREINTTILHRYLTNLWVNPEQPAVSQFL